jgi:hypothetical protein
MVSIVRIEDRLPISIPAPGNTEIRNGWNGWNGWNFGWDGWNGWNFGCRQGQSELESIAYMFFPDQHTEAEASRNHSEQRHHLHKKCTKSAQTEAVRFSMLQSLVLFGVSCARLGWKRGRFNLNAEVQRTKNRPFRYSYICIYRVLSETHLFFVGVRRNVAVSCEKRPSWATHMNKDDHFTKTGSERT